MAVDVIEWLRWRLLLAGVVVVAAGMLAACGAPPGDSVEAELVYSEASLPHEDGFAFIDIVTESDDLRAVWQRFGLPGRPLSIDLDKSALLVAGFGESSACPATFEGVYVDDTSDVLTLLTGQDGTACTDDYSPRTFVVQVDSTDLPADGFVLDLARVDRPSQGAFVLSAVPMEAPPEGPDVHLALVREGPLDLRLRAVPWAANGEAGVDIWLDSRDEMTIRAGGPLARLDRWHDQRWLPAEEQPATGLHPALSVRDRRHIGPGESDTIAVVDTTELDAGWYAVLISVLPDGGGRIDVHTHFEVVP